MNFKELTACIFPLLFFPFLLPTHSSANFLQSLFSVEETYKNFSFLSPPYIY